MFRALAQLNEVVRWLQRVFGAFAHGDVGYEIALMRVSEALYAFVVPMAHTIGVEETCRAIEGAMSVREIFPHRRAIVGLMRAWLVEDSQEVLGVKIGHMRLYSNPLDAIKHQIRQGIKDLDQRELFHRYSREERIGLMAVLQQAWLELPVAQFPVIDDELSGTLPEYWALVMPNPIAHTGEPILEYTDLLRQVRMGLNRQDRYALHQPVVKINGQLYGLLAKNDFNRLYESVIDGTLPGAGAWTMLYKVVPSREYMFEILLFMDQDFGIYRAFVKEYVFE